jgi:hypothetical protein
MSIHSLMRCSVALFGSFGASFAQSVTFYTSCIISFLSVLSLFICAQYSFVPYGNCVSMPRISCPTRLVLR